MNHFPPAPTPPIIGPGQHGTLKPARRNGQHLSIIRFIEPLLQFRAEVGPIIHHIGCPTGPDIDIDFDDRVDEFIGVWVREGGRRIRYAWR